MQNGRNGVSLTAEGVSAADEGTTVLRKADDFSRNNNDANS